MWSQNRRHVAVRLLLRRLALLCLLLLVAFAASGVWGVYKKERETSMRRGEAEAMRDDLKQREGELTADIQMLQSDRGLEETLREQFGLAHAGERLIIIVDAAEDADQATTTTRPWWRVFQWW